MKLGIIIDQKICQLEQGELEIIRSLVSNSSKKVTLITFKAEEPLFTKGKNGHKYSFATDILQRQLSLEKRRLATSDTKFLAKELTDYFNKTSVMRVFPTLYEDHYIFNKSDIDNITNMRFDLIIQLGESRLAGDVIKTAKYGIWFLNYFNRFSNIVLPKGFFELIMNESVVKISLMRYTENVLQGSIIDEAFFNYHKWSAFLTNNIVMESSVSLILKNLSKLSIKSSSKIPDLNRFEYHEANQSLVLGHTIKYISIFYRFYLKEIYKKFKSKINLNEKFWTLFIGSKKFLDQDLSTLLPVNVPEGEFWADPFLIEYNKEHYVFFENYLHKEKKGKISCGRIIGNEIVDVKDVLDLDYHLSYPFIFRDTGDIFMMPETSSNERLEIYKCLSFPDEWELYSTAFEGEKVADAFFYNDANNVKWLFLNKSATPNSCKTSDLFIYKVDSLKLKEIIPHEENPVFIDSRISRNGGSIFTYENKVFRPSQRNTHGAYGGRLNINDIKKLTLNEYVEEQVRVIEPDFYPSIKAIHHLHQMDDLFVFDASFNTIY